VGYRLARGIFCLGYYGKQWSGSQPDGDSVWFKPAHPATLAGLGRRPKYNAGGFTTLRFEAIDALELHYKGRQQQDKAARAARDFMLSALGFGIVAYSGKKRLAVRSCTPVRTSGYVLVREVDRYGRPVAFVFADKTPPHDEKDFFLKPDTAERSVNYALAEAGHAFPGYYASLPADIRRRFGSATVAARTIPRGVWQKDVSAAGFRATSAGDLEDLVIWPKLFRRLVGYFGSSTASLAGFDQWLRADPSRDDAMFILGLDEPGNMHDVVEYRNGRLKMKYRPEQLIITPQ
jgi:endonuclease YncB( thermonuclease family)